MPRLGTKRAKHGKILDIYLQQPFSKKTLSVGEQFNSILSITSLNSNVKMQFFSKMQKNMKKVLKFF